MYSVHVYAHVYAHVPGDNGRHWHTEYPVGLMDDSWLDKPS